MFQEMPIIIDVADTSGDGSETCPHGMDSDTQCRQTWCNNSPAGRQGKWLCLDSCQMGNECRQQTAQAGFQEPLLCPSAAECVGTDGVERLDDPFMPSQQPRRLAACCCNGISRFR